MGFPKIPSKPIRFHVAKEMADRHAEFVIGQREIPVLGSGGRPAVRFFGRATGLGRDFPGGWISSSGNLSRDRP